MKNGIEKLFVYYDRDVLSYYRTHAHNYKLAEDDMGGEIRVTDEWENCDQKKYPYIELKFGFRKLIDKTTVVAVFAPTIEHEIPEEHLSKWNSCHINDCLQFKSSDTCFERWVGRYIEGSWDVESGPRYQIERSLGLINSLTRNVIGIQFFKHSSHRLVNYPIAEHTEAYTKAILELYRLLIDGINHDAIKKIALVLDKELSNPRNRLNSLKELLNEEEVDKIHKPLKELDQKRMPIHGLPSAGIKKSNAFDTFNKDLINLSNGLDNLLSWLEKMLNTDAISCKEREDAMGNFPKIAGPPRPDFKLGDAQRLVNKTIRSIEFGELEEKEDVHESEALIMNFTDGTSMAIVIGSNAYDVSMQHKNMSSLEFCTDIMLYWADSIRDKS